MQCSDCNAVYSNELSFCPRCSVAARPAMRSTDGNIQTDDANVIAATPAKANSTLIEFPGTRTKLPEWRKELSERVREVQARKAREAELEAEANPQPMLPLALESAPALGLVPPPEVNPIVAKALERIENARRTVMVSRSSGGTALAVARAVEEPVMATPAPVMLAPAPVIAPIRPVPALPPVIEPEIEEFDDEVATEHGDSASVPSVDTAPLEELPVVARVAVEEQPKLFSTIDAETLPLPASLPVTEVTASDPTLDSLHFDNTESPTVIRLRRHDEPILDETESPLTVRAVAGVLDLMLVIFATSPFAAVIELSGGDWSDIKVWGALAAITAIVMVLYQASSVALSGRTWGMSLFSLRVADEGFGLYPTFGQSLVRAFVYLFSLVPAGLPLLSAIFNEDGLALHDRASRTVVVRHQ